MRFGVLGSVAVWAGGTLVPAGPPMQRAVLALLLLRANRPVGVDEIADRLWADEPPRTARKNIQVYVWKLRALIGERLVSSPPGYRLTIQPEELDLLEFDGLLESARTARRAGQAERAAAAYRAALELWRDAPLADLKGIGRFDAIAARLERRRLSAHEEGIDVELELGRHAEILPVLEELVGAYPLHERFAEQQIAVLDSLGRRADAVAAYRRCHRDLARELGVEPGPALQRLARVPAPPAGAPDGTPRQLPRTVETFTGRAKELALLRDRLTTPNRSAPAVCVVSGPAGVGKSALAVHAAHQLAEGFPDGQLYLDLHGATAGLRPMSPVEALGRFLRALGLADGAGPVHLEEAAARLRTHLADRRVLMVLDNAYNAAQVRPLLPASTTSAVLVTARRSLADLEGGTHLELGALPGSAALHLLGQLAGPTRVAADPRAAEELIRWSGGLPLAIRIVGARLAVRPNASLDGFAELLRDDRYRLRELRLGDVAVHTSVLVSYEQVRDPAARRLFRLLGALDGPDATAAAAAALLGEPLAVTRDTLEDLVDARLLEETPRNRYRMHDLIRLFARERAAEEPRAQREAALGRLLEYYLSTTRDAALLVYPGGLDDAAGAVAWLEDERADLVATTVQGGQSADRAVAGSAAALAFALYPFLAGRGHIEDLVAVNTACLSGAAQRPADSATQARLLHGLAVAHFYLHRVNDAITYLTESLTLSRESGDLDGQARALNQLGIVRGELGEYDRAAEHFKESLGIAKRLGNMLSCAATNNNIGFAYRLAGRYDEAIRYCRSAARLARRHGAPQLEANALDSLGELHTQLGRYDSARRYLRRSLNLRGVTGNERNRGDTFSSLVDVYLGTGRIGPAIRHAELAIKAYQRAGFRRGEALARRRLGRLLREHGDTGPGTEQLERAMALFTSLGCDEAAEIREELAIAA